MPKKQAEGLYYARRVFAIAAKSGMTSAEWKRLGRQKMKPEECPKLNDCRKIEMILDKDFPSTSSTPKPSGRSVLSAMRTMVTRDEVVKLRETGLTYAEIGRRLGISSERVRQILKGKLSRQKPNPYFKVMLTTSDVAHLLSIHVNTVRRWSNKRILKSYRIGSRRDRRFKREDIDVFLKEGESAKDQGFSAMG